MFSNLPCDLFYYLSLLKGVFRSLKTFAPIYLNFGTLLSSRVHHLVVRGVGGDLTMPLLHQERNLLQSLSQWNSFCLFKYQEPVGQPVVKNQQRHSKMLQQFWALWIIAHRSTHAEPEQVFTNFKRRDLNKTEISKIFSLLIPSHQESTKWQLEQKKIICDSNTN